MPDDRPRFDLQSHSCCSDGALAPAEVVARAAAAGVELLALTDHDTVEGVDEALRAGAEHGVRVVPAVEISTLDSEFDDLHVCAYRVDHREPRLLAALETSRAEREGRAGRMAAALRELGFVLEEQALARRRTAGLSIGRPHLAEAVVAHPANAERLREEGRAEPSAFLEAYLVPGAPAYRARGAPTVAEAIELIHDAGGLAVWAHPFWDLEHPDDVERAVARFAGLGLDGVEAFYVTHTREETRCAVDACARHGLLSTGSSDFHGPEHRVFRAFRAFSLHGFEADLGPLA